VAIAVQPAQFDKSTVTELPWPAALLGRVCSDVVEVLPPLPDPAFDEASGDAEVSGAPGSSCPAGPDWPDEPADGDDDAGAVAEPSAADPTVRVPVRVDGEVRGGGVLWSVADVEPLVPVAGSPGDPDGP
jgi:hypothetical protein